MNFALVQMDIAFGDPAANYRKTEELIAEAALKKPDVIVLPELWTTGYDLERLATIADRNGEVTKAFISSLAQKYQVNIVAGSIALQKEEAVYNTLLVFNRAGDLVKDYAKAHLFRLMREEKFLSAGGSDGLFQLEGIPAAGFICYDIRFPEWMRAHALKGAGLIVVPAEWPSPRIEHWRNLLISRAIENQSFVVACNRVGSDPDNAFGGHSLVINPWGEIISEGGEAEEILYAEVDPDQLTDIRKRIPVFEDRRPELYKAIFETKAVDVKD